jgi:hypothetical protein
MPRRAGWPAGVRAPALVLALALVAVLVAVGVVVLRRNDSSPAGTATGPGGSGPSATGAAAATTASVVSPFTGRPVPPDQPVLAVKIDNVRDARPQTGLDRADIVYVEPVEGGLSRIMAIYSTELPSRVGPVRSARESDLELLAQFGRPGLAYSGANRTVLSAIRDAPVVDLSPDRVPTAYRRSPAQAAPHNLIADPHRLLRAAKGISPAHDIGFRFGLRPAGLGTPQQRTVIRYGAASTGFTWSAGRKRWDVSLDGRPARTVDGARLTAATVVVQYTEITASNLHDVLGNATPYTHTVGSGTALVLRDGQAVPARWSRPSAEGGTAFTTSSGATLPFAAGPVWVVYAKAASAG